MLYLFHSVCLHVRVSIGAKKGGPFNSTPTDGSERVRRFEQLLTGPVGEGLCRMYASYWQPAGMARYLEEAALYSKDHKSTVSITDSVSSTSNCIPLMNYECTNILFMCHLPWMSWPLLVSWVMGTVHTVACDHISCCNVVCAFTQFHCKNLSHSPVEHQLNTTNPPTHLSPPLSYPVPHPFRSHPDPFPPPIPRCETSSRQPSTTSWPTWSISSTRTSTLTSSLAVTARRPLWTSSSSSCSSSPSSPSWLR